MNDQEQPSAKVESIELEREKLAQEATFRSRELDLHERELDLQELEAKAKAAPMGSRWPGRSTIVAGAISAVLGLAGAWVAAYYQGLNAKELEQKKLESQLILKAIVTGSPNDSARNLIFLRDAGLISDPNGHIENLKENPMAAPVLPSSTSANGRARRVGFEFTKSTGIRTLRAAIDGIQLRMNEQDEIILSEGLHVLSWFVQGESGSEYSLTLSSADHVVFSETGRLRSDGPDFGESRFYVTLPD